MRLQESIIEPAFVQRESIRPVAASSLIRLFGRSKAAQDLDDSEENRAPGNDVAPVSADITGREVADASDADANDAGDDADNHMAIEAAGARRVSRCGFACIGVFSHPINRVGDNLIRIRFRKAKVPELLSDGKGIAAHVEAFGDMVDEIHPFRNLAHTRW